jgi:hypothetical protein
VTFYSVIRIGGVLKKTVLCTALFVVFHSLSAWAMISKPFLQMPTSTSIWVSWKTESESESVVRYGPTTALGKRAEGYVVKIGERYFWHLVKLDDLQPATAYYYQCFSESETSGLFRFRTQPPSGSKNGHYRFLLYGDNQSNPAVHRSIVENARATCAALYGSPVEEVLNLVVNVGDVVGTGGNLTSYQTEFFQPAATLSGNVPYLVANGNHEYSGDAGLANFFGHFVRNDFVYQNMPCPEAAHYYTCQGGSSLFILLNSVKAGPIQGKWLNSILAAAQQDQTVEWAFAFAHHPPQCEEMPGDGSYWVRENVVPTMGLFDKAVLYGSGHSHLYARGASPEFSVTTIISGGAGGGVQFWYDDPTQTDYVDIQKTICTWNYVIVDIDLDRQELIGRMYSLGTNARARHNELMDVFVRKRVSTRPLPPQPAAISATVSLPHTLYAGPYFGQEPINSSQFQFIDAAGSFAKPLVDVKRDFENIFLDTGSPEWQPIDQNNGVDLEHLLLTRDMLPASGRYVWRVRFRDRNLRWSNWSGEQSIDIRLPELQTESVNNRCIQFDGSTTYIEIADQLQSVALPVRAMTVETWVRLSSRSTWGGFIGAFQDNGNYEKGWVLGNYEGSFSFALSSKGADDGDGKLTYLTTGEALEIGQWYHVAASYDGSSMRIYVNGRLKSSSRAHSGDILYDPSSFFDIGIYHDANEFFPLNGQLDEVRLWSTAVDESVLQKWMHQEVDGHHPYYAQLISYWDLNAVRNDSVFDACGRNHALVRDFKKSSSIASTAPLGQIGAFVETRSPAGAGPEGTRIEVTIVSTPSNRNCLGLYQADDLVGIQHSSTTFPAGIDTRSSCYWGIREYGDVTANISIVYKNAIGGIPADSLRLLKRTDAADIWQDITDMATNDVDEFRFTIDGETVFGEFAVGWKETATGVAVTNAVPVKTTLLGNYPNPYNMATTASFVLSARSAVTLTVYDIRGREIATVIDHSTFEAGQHAVIWDGKDQYKTPAASGIYFLSLTAGDLVSTRKTVLVK